MPTAKVLWQLPQTHTDMTMHHGQQNCCDTGGGVVCYFFMLQEKGKDNEIAILQLVVWHVHSRQLSFTTITHTEGVSPLCWESQAWGSLETTSK